MIEFKGNRYGLGSILESSKLPTMSSVSSVNTSKYTCLICGYQACQKRKLTLHEQAVHKGKTFQCPECEY